MKIEILGPDALNAKSLRVLVTLYEIYTPLR
jgi:hypothetical protein